MREVLANTTYARLFSAQIIALIGTGLLTVALGLLAYDIAGADAGVVLGTALTIKMVAYVVVSPLMAALTARLPRRGVLIAADLLRAAIALMLPWVGQVWQIYLLVFVLQSASATFTPVFQALIPDVLPEEGQYTRALSLSRLAYDLESVLSPVLAAGLLVVMSYHDLFVGTGLGFLASAALVLITRLPVRAHSAPTRFWTRLTRGGRLYLHQPQLRSLLAMNLVVATATAMVLVNTVVVVRVLLAGDDTQVALLLAAYGAGSMVVALGMPKLLDRLPDRPVMLAGAAALPAGLVAAAGVLAYSPRDLRWSALLAVWAALGAATSMVLTPSARLLRRAASAGERPAVFAAQFSLSHACFMVTYPLAGSLGARLGLPATALVLAGIAVVGLGLAWAAWRPGAAPPEGAADRTAGADPGSGVRTPSPAGTAPRRGDSPAASTRGEGHP